MDVICKAMHTESNELCYITKENDIKYFISDEELEEESKVPYINVDDYNEEENHIVGKYKHFKGNDYEVLGIAYDTCKNKYVFYKALYERDIKYFVRPFDMFFSEVDKEKYPDVEQKMRFEKIEEN